MPPFHHYRGPPPPVKRWEARLRRKRPLRHYVYLPTPVWGWVASGARRKGAASAGSYKNGAPYFQRAPSSIYHLQFTIYHSPFTIFSGPLPPLSWSPSRPVGKRVTGFSVVCRLPTNPVPLPPQAVGGKIKEKKATPPLCLLAHPRLGGGWRAERDGRGRLPQEAIKMAPHIFKGRLPPFTIHHLPFTIFKRPPSTTIVVPLPRQVEVHSTSSHTSSYSNSDTLRSRFPATRACYPDTSG